MTWLGRETWSRRPELERTGEEERGWFERGRARKGQGKKRRGSVGLLAKG